MDSTNFPNLNHGPYLGVPQNRPNKRSREDQSQLGKTKQARSSTARQIKQEFNSELNKSIYASVFDGLLNSPIGIVEYFSDMTTLKQLFKYAKEKGREDIVEQIKIKVSHIFVNVCMERNASKAQHIANGFQIFEIEDVNHFLDHNRYSREESKAINDVIRILKIAGNENLEAVISESSDLENLKTIFNYAIQQNIDNIPHLVQQRVIHLFLEECKKRNMSSALIIGNQFDNFDISFVDITDEYLNPEKYSPEEIEAINDAKTVLFASFQHNIEDIISDCSNLNLLKTFFSFIRSYPRLSHLEKHLQKHVAFIFFEECSRQNVANASLIAKEFRYFDIDDINDFKVEFPYGQLAIDDINKTMNAVQLEEISIVITAHVNDDLCSVVSRTQDPKKLKALYLHAINENFQDIAEQVKMKVISLFINACENQHMHYAYKFAKLLKKFEITNIQEISGFFNSENYSPEELKAITDTTMLFEAFFADNIYEAVSATSDLGALKIFFLFTFENRMHDLVDHIRQQVAFLFIDAFKRNNPPEVISIAREFNSFGAEHIRKLIQVNAPDLSNAIEGVLRNCSEEDERKE